MKRLERSEREKGDKQKLLVINSEFLNGANNCSAPRIMMMIYEICINTSMAFNVYTPQRMYLQWTLKFMNESRTNKASEQQRQQQQPRERKNCAKSYNAIIISLKLAL
jgi:hypothetical protein